MRSIEIELNGYRYFSIRKPKTKQDALLLVLKFLSYAILIAPLYVGILYNCARLYNRRIRQLTQKESKLPLFQFLNRDIQFTYIEYFRSQIKSQTKFNSHEVFKAVKRFNIKNEELLLELANTLANRNPYIFGLKGHKLNISTQDKIAALTKIIIKVPSVYSYIQQSGLTDQKILIDLAKQLVSCDPLNFCKNIQIFQIKDQNVLLELATAVLKQNGLNLADYLDKFKIQDQEIFLELAKRWLDLKPHSFCQNVKKLYIVDFDLQTKLEIIEKALITCTHSVICDHFEDFGIRDQKNLLEIADKIKWLYFYSANLAKYIEKFNCEGEKGYVALVKRICRDNYGVIFGSISQLNIPKEEDRTDIARIAFKVDEYGYGSAMLAANISNFSITNQAVLIDFAKHCAKDGHCSHFEDFKITEEDQRFEIAKIALEHRAAFSKYLRTYQITNKAHLLDLAKLAAKHDFSFPKHVEGFAITDQKILVELAQICIENHISLSEHIRNFKILNQNTIIELAEKIAEYDCDFPKYVTNFNIKDSDTLAKLANTTANNKLSGLSRHIHNFQLQDQNLLINLAEKAAEYDCDFPKYVANFNIKDSDTLAKLANTTANNKLSGLSEHILNFQLQDQNLLLKLAEKAAEYDCDFPKYVMNFEIKDSGLLIRLAEIAAYNQSNSLSRYIENFKIQDQVALIKLARNVVQYDQQFPCYVDLFKIEDQKILLELAKAALAVADHQRYFCDNLSNFNLSTAQGFELVFRDIAYEPSRLGVYLDSRDLNESIKKINLEELSCLEPFYKKQSKEERRLLKPWLQYIRFLYVSQETEEGQIKLSDLIKSEPQKFQELYLAIARLQHPKLRYTLAFLAFNLFKAKDSVFLYNEFLNVSSHRLVSLLLSHLCECFPESKEQLIIIATLCRAKKASLKDSSQLCSLLETLITTIETRGEPLDFIVKTLEDKSSEKIKQEFFAIQGIIQCGEAELLSQKNKPIQELYQQAVQKLIPLNYQSDFLERYLGTIGKEYDSASLIVYAGRLKVLRDEDDRKLLLDLLSTFVKSILDNTYLSLRYRENQHTKRVFKGRQILKNKWMNGAKLSVKLDESSNVSVNYEKQFKYAIQHAHLGSFPYLKEYLDVIETRAKVKEQLLKTEKDAKIEIQHLAIELIEGVEEPLKKLAELKKLLRSVGESKEFINDITVLMDSLRKQNEDVGEITLHDTDDAWQMFLSGTRVKGSCQRVDGNVELNKCLISLPLDPKRRLVWVEKRGEMIAHTIMRILIDRNDNPVLMQERVYPFTASKKIQEALIEFAKLRAHSLGIPLYKEGWDTVHLKSLAGPSYEYVDSHKDKHIHSNGIYTIPTACLVTGNVSLRKGVRQIIKRYLQA